MKWWYPILFLFSLCLKAQEIVLDTFPATVFGNDTLIVKQLPEVKVFPKLRTEFSSRRQRRYYGRLLRDVKKTLPYAKLAGALLVQVNDSLQKIPSKHAQDLFLKSMEKELLSEYEPALKKMSIRQGRVLIKLIDRECQITSYEVVKMYRGGFSAFFWQGLARLFGNDLKSVYDPYGDDALMEEVVLLVESKTI